MDLRHNERFIGWLIALIMALVFFIYIAMSCVNVKIMTGGDAESDKESNAIKNTIQKDSLP